MPVSFIFLKVTFQNKTTLEASDKPFKLSCFLFLRDLVGGRESATDIAFGATTAEQGRVTSNQEPLALSNPSFLHSKPWVRSHNRPHPLLLVRGARTLPSGRQCQCQGVLLRLKVMLSLSSTKRTPDLVRWTSEQNYPWKEKNRPEFLEKNQQPKDKTQTESLMVHSFINGNLTKAPFLFFLRPPPPAALPSTSH